MKGHKLTNKEFKERINEIFGERYDLSKADVENRDEKGRICIICPEHGEFYKTPNNILLGHGCPKCAFKKMGDAKSKTTKWFIEKAKEIHGDKYNYNKVKYNGNRNKVCIICPEHGEFWQTPNNHLKGEGCKFCAFDELSKKKKMDIKSFIEKSIKIHNNKYDYRKVDLENRDEKGRVCIICPEHGEFWQTPNSHLQGNGCKKCSKSNPPIKLTTEEFIERAKAVHGDKYDYSKVKYEGTAKKVTIICPIHGEFRQIGFLHLKGCKCPKCSDNQKLTTEEFIERAKAVHGDKYDYSKVKYINNRTKIPIFCNKKDENGIEHGEFYTTPHLLLKGSGCPKCKQNYKLENEVRLLLVKNNIDFEEKKTFDGLKRKIALRPDFYLPKYNIVIECQGEQHFKPINFSGRGKEYSEKMFEINKERDEIKRKYFYDNNITMLEYTHCKDTNGVKCVTTKSELLEKILENGTRN